MSAATAAFTYQSAFPLIEQHQETLKRTRAPSGSTQTPQGQVGARRRQLPCDGRRGGERRRRWRASTEPRPRRLRSVGRAARTFPRRSPTAATRWGCRRRDKRRYGAGGNPTVRRLAVAPEVHQGSAHVPDLHGESRAGSQKDHLRVAFSVWEDKSSRIRTQLESEFRFTFQETSPEPSAASKRRLPHASTSWRKFGTSDASFTKSSGLQTGMASLPIRAQTGVRGRSLG